jgi:hypothetical protein
VQPQSENLFGVKRINISTRVCVRE